MIPQAGAGTLGFLHRIKEFDDIIKIFVEMRNNSTVRFVATAPLDARIYPNCSSTWSEYRIR